MLPTIWGVYVSWIYMLILDISCQHLGDDCKLEGFCVPFGHRVGNVHLWKYEKWMSQKAGCHKKLDVWKAGCLRAGCHSADQISDDISSDILCCFFTWSNIWWYSIRYLMVLLYLIKYLMLHSSALATLDRSSECRLRLPAPLFLYIIIISYPHQIIFDILY